MKQCPDCHAAVKGEWTICPLCHQALRTTDTEGASYKAYPNVPLRFNQQRVTRWLIWTSFLLIAVYFVVDFFVLYYTNIWRFVLFGIVSMWLVVLIILRKKRNIAKSMLYLLVLLSLMAVYLDNLQGWYGWSLTYAIPIICSTSLIAMFIASQISRLSVGDYVLYVLMAALLGFVPAVFLVMDWTRLPVVAWVSVILSFLMLVYILLRHGSAIKREFKKRFDI